MMLTLPVGRLLREAAPPYRHLVTRATGRAVRGAIEAALAEQPCRAACLDFHDVEVMDYSGAEEVVAQLLLRTGEGWPVVTVRGVGAEPAEAITHVLEHHELAIVVLADDGRHLLGAVTPDAHLVFQHLSAEAARACRDVAAELVWDEPRARRALERLCAMRVARADEQGYRALA